MKFPNLKLFENDVETETSAGEIVRKIQTRTSQLGENDADDADL